MTKIFLSDILLTDLCHIQTKEFREYTQEEALAFTRRTPLELTREAALELLGPTITQPELLPINPNALQGKVALITGSSRGIGAATARLFAEYGMQIVVNGTGSENSRKNG